MHKILSRQISRAQKANSENEFSIDKLLKIIEEFYEEVDRERKIKDRSLELMSDELNELNSEIRAIGEKQLALIMENVEDGIVLLDENFSLLNGNKSFNKLLEIISKKEEDDDNLKKEKWKQIIEKFDFQNLEFPCRKNLEFFQNQKSFHYEISINPTILFENPGYIGILRDVTQSKELKEKLEKDQEFLIHKIEKNESALIELSDSLDKESSDRKAAEATLEFLAYHDALTGLMNRVAMKEFFDQRITNLKPNQKIAVLFTDLDKFKIINDSLGHHTGDMLLQQVGKRLEQTIGSDGKISRQGGDEFIIILDTIQDTKDIELVCQRLIQEISREYLILDHSLLVDLTIGVSIYPDNGTDFESLVISADTAMYAAKDQGVGKYEFYTTEMSLNVYEQLILGNWLKLALRKNELLLLFQPKYNVKNKIIDSAEALIRWNHPERGIISPMTFIPIAEQSGIIGKIGDWIIEQACVEINHWNLNYFPIRIAINLSPIQFSNPKIHENIETIIKRYQINPNLLEIEITESGVMKDIQYTKKILNRLKDLGVIVTIDDFGTGYSSLSYLKELPVDNLKIDKSFIDGIPNNTKDCAIVEAIVTLAKKLGLYVIAEGVEKVEQKEFLIQSGCDSIQGYLIGKPQSRESLRDLTKGIVPN